MAESCDRNLVVSAHLLPPRAEPRPRQRPTVPLTPFAFHLSNCRSVRSQFTRAAEHRARPVAPLLAVLRPASREGCAPARRTRLAANHEAVRSGLLRHAVARSHE